MTTVTVQGNLVVKIRLDEADIEQVMENEQTNRQSAIYRLSHEAVEMGHDFDLKSAEFKELTPLF